MPPWGSKKKDDKKEDKKGDDDKKDRKDSLDSKEAEEVRKRAQEAEEAFKKEEEEEKKKEADDKAKASDKAGSETSGKGKGGDADKGSSRRGSKGSDVPPKPAKPPGAPPPDPKPQAAAAAAPPAGKDSPFLQILMDFYERHNQAKSEEDIIHLLTKYAGYEEDLYQGMEELYGERPRWPPKEPPKAARLSPQRTGRKPRAAAAGAAPPAAKPASPRREGQERRLWFTDEWPDGIPLSKQDWLDEGLNPWDWDSAPAEQLYAVPSKMLGPLPRKVRVRRAKLKDPSTQGHGEFHCCRCPICLSLLHLLLHPAALNAGQLVADVDKLRPLVEKLQRKLAAKDSELRKVQQSNAAADAHAAKSRAQAEVKTMRQQVGQVEGENARLREQAQKCMDREEIQRAQVQRQSARLLGVVAEQQNSCGAAAAAGGRVQELEARLRDAAAREEEHRLATAELRKRLAEAQRARADAESEAMAERRRGAEAEVRAASVETELARARDAARRAAEDARLLQQQQARWRAPPPGGGDPSVPVGTPLPLSDPPPSQHRPAASVARPLLFAPALPVSARSHQDPGAASMDVLRIPWGQEVHPQRPPSPPPPRPAALPAAAQCPPPAPPAAAAAAYTPPPSAPGPPAPGAEWGRRVNDDLLRAAPETLQRMRRGRRL